jgi:hypothetical protein
MATYRFAVEMKFGKLHGHLVKVGERPHAAAQPALESVSDLLNYLNDQLEAKAVEEDDDAVIFRNVAYEDFAQLESAVKQATY